jgi:hypothetical protein
MAAAEVEAEEKQKQKNEINNSSFNAISTALSMYYSREKLF